MLGTWPFVLKPFGGEFLDASGILFVGLDGVGGVSGWRFVASSNVGAGWVVDEVSPRVLVGSGSSGSSGPSGTRSSGTESLGTGSSESSDSESSSGSGSKSGSWVFAFLRESFAFSCKAFWRTCAE